MMLLILLCSACFSSYREEGNSVQEDSDPRNIERRNRKEVGMPRRNENAETGTRSRKQETNEKSGVLGTDEREGLRNGEHEEGG